MTELKKSLDILKARWPEVTLIASLQILRVLNSWCRTAKMQWPNIGLVLFMGSITALMVFSLILICGFLRTTHLEGQKRQTVLTLLKTGKRFFWRIFWFSLLFLVTYFLLARFFFFLFKQFVSIETPFFQTAQTHPWVYFPCFTLSTLILIKFILFISALIIVLNCRLFESFKFLKFIKLYQAKGLVVLFLASYSLGLFETFFFVSYKTSTILFYVLRLVFAVIGFLAGFWVSVAAVRFVASLDLVYDKGSGNLDSEDLQKSSDQGFKE